MEIKNYKPVETILKKGILPTEEKRQIKLESYLEKQSKAKSFKTLLQVKRMIAQNLPKDQKFSREDIIFMFKSIQEDYKKFERVGIVFEKSWRGKSGIISIIKEPDRVIIQRAKKSDIGEEPKLINIEISKNEINSCLVILGKLNIGDKIESKNIFMSMSRLLELGHTEWDRGDKPFETDRKLHNSWTTLLGFLHDEGLIKYYRSGKVKLLKDNFSIQEILE